MTLLEILPSLRTVMAYRLDPTLWPAETHYAGGRITVGGVAVEDIANQYGTPCEIVDEVDLRSRCRNYRRTFASSEIVYNADDLAFEATARLVVDEQLSVRVGSAAELTTALAAGVDPRRIIMQGNTAHDLRTAMARGAGRIVIGSASDVAQLVTGAVRPQKVVVQAPLRASRRTEGTINAVVAHRRLQLVGLRGDVGESLCTPEPFVAAVRELVAQMAQMRSDYGLITTELHLAGNHSLRRQSCDHTLDLAELRTAIDDALDDSCARFRFPRPTVVLAPGRAVTAGAAVTALRVTEVRSTEPGNAVVTVDGDWSTAEPHDVAIANRHPLGPFLRATVRSAAGTITDDVELPADIHPGEVLAVACTGDLECSCPTLSVWDRNIRDSAD